MCVSRVKMSFSSLRLLKTLSKSRMSEEWLKDQALISIHKNINIHNNEFCSLVLFIY